MPALTGTAGGRNGLADNQDDAIFFRALLQGEIGTVELNDFIRAHETPVNVSMVVNNACNLACRHCYLQIPKDSSRPLTDPEWEELFVSAFRADTTLLSLNGKEVFVDAKGPRLLGKLAELRAKLAPEKRIGVITNGTLIAPHRDLIETSDLTFLDISVDGTPADHDAIRGTGAFAAMLPNLKWAVSTLKHRAFASLTAQKRNLPRFNDALLHLNDLGVQHAGVSFYHPAPYNDTGLTLTDKDHAKFIDRLHELTASHLDRPLTVFIEVDTLSPVALLAFLRSDWFAIDRIEMDRSRVPWIEWAFPNGLRLQFKFSPIPWAGYHTVRITQEGTVLADDDMFDTRFYKSRAMSNAREHNCDLAAMMRAAHQSPRVQEIISGYESRLLPQLVASAHHQAR